MIIFIEKKRFILGLLFFGLAGSELMERLIDHFIGDGDGVILSANTSLWITLIQVLFLFLIFFLFFINAKDSAKTAKLKLILLLFCIGFTFLLVELLCHMLIPAPIKRQVGSRQAPKAALYGWHHFPEAQLFFKNPDDVTDSCSYKVNKEGWKDINHTRAKTPGTTRILLLGGSPVFGVCRPSEIIAREVEKKLSMNGINAEVISMGMGGYSTDHSLEILINEGLSFNPDIVIHQFSPGYFNINTFSKDEKIPPDMKKPFYYRLNDEKNLERIWLGIPEQKKIVEPSLYSRVKIFLGNIATVRFVRNYIINRIKNYVSKEVEQHHWWDQYTFVLSFLKHGYTTIHSIDDERIRNKWIGTEKLFLKFDSLAKAHSFRFLLHSESSDEGARKWELEWNRIIFKNGKDYIMEQDSLYEIDFKSNYKILLDIGRRNDIGIIPIKREYTRYKMDPHCNKFGNKNIAEDIAEYLMEKQLVNQRVFNP
ncbi:MAG: hypothetical protein HQK83_14740 [Fibrobacteria bacterium]|nr:hypothetical protein [Fibrobacteria bacterium]